MLTHSPVARRIWPVLLLAALALLAAAPAALAAPAASASPAVARQDICPIPPTPHSFSGSVQIAVNPPAAGTLIVAAVPGAPVFSTPLFLNNTTGNLEYSLFIPPDGCPSPEKDGAVENDPITFSISGRTVATSVWHAGRITTQNINLTVDHIAISPKTAAIAYGGTQAFTTEAFTVLGWTMGDATPVSAFSISAGAGGSWTGNVYSAGNSGDFTVTGTCNGRSDTASLHVGTPNVPPIQPSSFWGAVRTGDASVQAGASTVQVSVPGVAAPFATTVQDDPESGLVYQINVPGDDDTTVGVKEGGVENDLLTLSIAGRTFATARWHSGTYVNLNLHPPLAALAAPAATEGTAAMLDARGTLDLGTDIVTFTFDCGGGTLSAGAQTGTALCTFADDGDYTASVQVLDAQGGAGGATLGVHAANAAPVVDLGTPTSVSINAGDAFSRAGSFTDPGADTWTATVNYGDGGGVQTLALNPTKTFNLSHTYTQPGSFTITVVVNDGDGGTGNATLSVTVAAARAEAGGPYTGVAGAPVSLAGTASCPLNHTCLTEWLYDGSIIGTLPNLQYTWYSAGAFTVMFRVRDTTANLTATDTAQVTIAAASASVHLYPGWNLVSFDMAPANTSPDVILAGIAGRYDLVYAWDGQTQQWRKADNVPSSPDDLTVLTERMGFWIEITGSTPVDLTVQGNIPLSTDISLYRLGQGWNLVGYPAGHDILLAPNVIPALKLAYAFDRQRTPDPWRIYDPTALGFANTLKTLTPRWGYWVQVTADGTWTVTR